MTSDISAMIRIINTNIDLLRRNIKPLVWYPGSLCLLRHFFEIRLSRMRRWEGLFALEEHVQQGLEMHNFMLKAAPDRSPYVTRDVFNPSVIQTS